MASLDLGTLKVGVKVDGADKAKAELKTLSGSFKDINEESKSSSKGVDGLTTSLGESSKSGSFMTGAIAGLSAGLVSLATKAASQAAEALLEVAKASIQAASDAEETKNVLNVAFGEQGTSEIESWANTMIMAFGMSSNEASNFASKFGLMFKDFGNDSLNMSKACTELSGDLASLYNTDVESAFTSVQAFFAGETEPMRKYGVFASDAALNQFALASGIEKTTQQMTEQEKMQLRYNFLLNETVVAQGDAIRSEGSYAKTLKQTKSLWEEFLTKLGELLLPIVNGTLMLLNEILGIFTDTGEKANMALEAESKKAIGISNDANKEVQKGAASHYSTMEDMNKSHVETMEELSKSSQSYLEKEMSNYEKKLRETYDETTRSGRAAIEKRLENKRRELEESYRMEEEHYRKITQLATRSSNSSSSGSIPRYANGTLSAQGGFSVVGEVGRELMYVPPKAQIFNNNTTERILGSGGTTITGNTFIVQANDYQEFVDSMERSVICGEW